MFASSWPSVWKTVVGFDPRGNELGRRSCALHPDILRICQVEFISTCLRRLFCFFKRSLWFLLKRLLCQNMLIPSHSHWHSGIHWLYYERVSWDSNPWPKLVDSQCVFFTVTAEKHYWTFLNMNESLAEPAKVNRTAFFFHFLCMSLNKSQLCASVMLNSV